MDNAATSSLSELPLEARTLMANMTISHREINRLVKENCKKLDPFFSLELKNEAAETYIKHHGRMAEIAISEYFVNNLLHLGVDRAYRKGYENALKQYSGIVRWEVRKAAKGCVSSDSNIVTCSFCGKTQEQAKKLVAGSDNVFICDACAEMCAQLCGGEDSSIDNDNIVGRLAILTPMEIHKKLDEYIIGQEDAKKTLSVAVYNHYKRIALFEQSFEAKIQKSNILILGQSGSGKTYLAQTMAKLLNVPFAIADATALTEAGYIGEDVETVLQKLIQAADGDVGQAERGIVFIDEIDKIARSSESHSNRRDVGGESVQQALLKIIEGTVATVPLKGVHKDSKSECVQLDTTNILFICGGDFAGIEKIIGQRTNNSVIGFSARDNSVEADADMQVDTQDLQKFGLIPEIIGRLPVVVSLTPLDKNALVSILTEPKDAIIEQYKHFLKMDNVTLEFTCDALTAIAEQAIVRKTGARGLRTIIESFMRDIMYEIPSKRGRIEKVTIRKETVTEKKLPEIVCRNEQCMKGGN